MALMRGAQALLQGTGNTRILMVMAFFDAGLRLVFSYLFGIMMGYGFFGFVLGFGLAAYGVAIPGTVYFFTGRWKKTRFLDS